MKSNVDVVFFDAAGTLFKVRGSVGGIYSRIAERYHVMSDPEEVEAQFRAAFHTKSLESPPAGASEGSQAEKAWWMEVVRRVFAGKMQPDVLSAYFHEVFEAFRGATAWELYPDTCACLKSLGSRGCRLAVISNFDSRLFDVLANLGIASCFERVVLSWHTGAAKPDPAIFLRALETMHAPARRALHVGDSLHEDVAGASAAGLASALLDRSGKHRDWDRGCRLESLLDLPRMLAQLSK